jgi:hypothetical protein
LGKATYNQVQILLPTMVAGFSQLLEVIAATVHLPRFLIAFTAPQALAAHFTASVSSQCPTKLALLIISPDSSDDHAHEENYFSYQSPHLKGFLKCLGTIKLLKPSDHLLALQSTPNLLLGSRSPEILFLTFFAIIHLLIAFLIPVRADKAIIASVLLHWFPTTVAIVVAPAKLRIIK